MVRLRRRHKLLLMVVWIVLVLYPNPSLLATTIARSLNPPIDASAVRKISAELPDDPAHIERLVLNKYVPYAYDWTVFGVPWYFPTPAEVVMHGRGDCEARAVVLASIFEEKQIPYDFNVSPTHIWVKYTGKVENEVESSAVAFVEHRDGVYRVKLPSEFDLESYVRVEIDSLWGVMPASRKIMLFGGIAFILVVDFLATLVVHRLRQRRTVPVALEKR